jgi:hypothetical protein
MINRDTEEMHAAAIRSALTSLNGAISAAWNDGLRVDVDVLRVSQMARRDALPLIEVTVYPAPL